MYCQITPVTYFTLSAILVIGLCEAAKDPQAQRSAFEAFKNNWASESGVQKRLPVMMKSDAVDDTVHFREHWFHSDAEQKELCPSPTSSACSSGFVGADCAVCQKDMILVNGKCKSKPCTS